MGSFGPVVVLLVIVAIFLVSSIRVVPQTYIYIVERLGKYYAQWDAGIHLKMPFIDSVVSKVSLKEQVLDFPPQPVITKDNVTMRIDSIVFMRVTDAKLFTYGVANPIVGVENLSATTLRNIVGSMDFDETLTSRDTINAQMEQILDEATDEWGIKVTRVEIKNIQPPTEIQEVMTKQMRAERERRQTVLEAEAHQQSIVTRAEGDKKAKVLAAEAERDAQIALAEGQAKSIRLVYEAESEGLAKLNETGVDASILKLKSIEAAKDIADGNATKIFMPTDIASSLSALSIAGESFGLSPKGGVTKPRTQTPHKDNCMRPETSPLTKDASRTSARIDDEVSKNRVGKRSYKRDSLPVNDGTIPVIDVEEDK